jgi:translation initiation factor RLI1
MLNITKGKIDRAQKVVIYGPEGIGKSSLGAKFPDPVIIDTEGGTAHMDVRRIDKPQSWDEGDRIHTRHLQNARDRHGRLG